MCFYPRKSALKAKVAKSDLIAFKLVKRVNKNTAWSPFQDKVWVTGVEITSSLLKELDYKGQDIHQGLHSFKTVKSAQSYEYRESHHVIVPVMIPKDSVYWENETQIVSNKMIMLGTNLSVFRKVARKLK
jgi:hypothetical protein